MHCGIKQALSVTAGLNDEHDVRFVSILVINDLQKYMGSARS